MSFRPGLANLASVIADPAREAILVALATGRARPAGELAEIAGVSPQSASRHLQRLVDGHLLEVWTQGRFRYYRIASEEIAALLESMCAIASRVETSRVRGLRARTLPQSLRDARRCYNHLAGRLGVELAQAFRQLGYVTIVPGSREAAITPAGLRWLGQIGVALPRQRIFRLCMDGTERRPHLAGATGAAVLKFLEDKRLLIPDRNEPRALSITAAGEVWLARLGVGPGASAPAA